MSRTFKILPGPTSRTPSGTNAPAAACRFLESSANSFIFQGKQQYTGPYGNFQFWLPNQRFTTSSGVYAPGSNQRIIGYSVTSPNNFSLNSDITNVIAETKLFSSLRVDEYEQIDLSLNGIDLSSARVTSNYTIEYITDISDFTIDEFPDNPTLQTVLTGTTGNITSTKTLILEEAHIGSGNYIANNNGGYIDSYCYARFGAYFSNTTPWNAVWLYNRDTKVWTQDRAVPGVPDDNAFHLYIDWYFG